MRERRRVLARQRLCADGGGCRHERFHAVLHELDQRVRIDTGFCRDAGDGLAHGVRFSGQQRPWFEITVFAIVEGAAAPHGTALIPAEGRVPAR
jgi:hypothetical protein